MYKERITQIMVQHPDVKMRVCGVAIEEQLILLIRHDYPNERPMWHIPGGGAEPGEMLTDALQREFQEELNLAVDIGALRFVCDSVRTHDGGQVVHLIFDVCRASQQQPELNPANTTGQSFCWVPLRELPAMRLYPNIGTQVSQLECKGSAFRGTENLGHIFDTIN
ncbi:MAG: NUDIX hydrolase [Caldilineaceae bacterium]|nr:NUDIX hydrolase [Caldilineaceae bacterium]